jgi:hypothetical protein
MRRRKPVNNSVEAEFYRGGDQPVGGILNPGKKISP